MMLALGGVEKRAMTSWHVIAWRLQSAISDRRFAPKTPMHFCPSQSTSECAFLGRSLITLSTCLSHVKTSVCCHTPVITCAD